MKNVSGRGFLLDEKKLLLVFITVLFITGFQVYWLRDNYIREKKTLEIKTDGLFRETVRNVQDSVLQKKLSLVLKDSTLLELKGKGFNRKGLPDRRTARIAALLGERVIHDSLRRVNSGRTGVFVALRKRPGDDTSETQQISPPGLQPETIDEMIVVKSGSGDLKRKDSKDTLQIEREFRQDQLINRSQGEDSIRRINTIYLTDNAGRQIIIKVDSLFNDTVSVSQLSREFARVLKSENLDVPFSILQRQRDSVVAEEDRYFPRSSFGNDMIYLLQLGNTFPYLLKRITLPILFSLFLIGVTVFSFILLYRSLIHQQRLAAMKNEFISNITHELKTPIATVGVAIEALRNFGAAQSPEKTKEYLDISASELERLSLLVDKVLKLSMLENKEVQLRKEKLDLLQLVNEAINTMKLQLEKQHATLRIQPSGDDFVIEADKLHLTSVIYNLLDNALKYSQEQPVIEIALSTLPNDIIELKISDNGIGIPKEYKWKIFEKFFRVPSGNTHNVKGYGLGLSYVSEIIRRHMGFIEVESEPGKGAVFTIKIPRREADVVAFDGNRKIYRKVIHIGPLIKGRQA